MKQVLIIHGGDSFSSYEAYLTELKSIKLDYNRLLPKKRWKDTLEEALPDADILMPSMPNSANAQFEEWKIWFEKIIPYFGDNVRIVGHSLGAMFLAKYLQSKPLKTPVRQIILLAARYNTPESDDGSFAVLSATNLAQSAQEVHLMHSTDDLVVPFDSLAKFQADIPTAKVHAFEDRGHFNTETFPELLDLLKQK